MNKKETPKNNEALADFIIVNILKTEPKNGFKSGKYTHVMGLFEVSLITLTYKEYGFNQTKTAEHLGISRSMLINRLKRYGIEKGVKNDS